MDNGSINKVGIALLCETWLQADSKKFVNLPSHNYIGKECIGKRGGGVGIMISKQLKFQPRCDLEIDSISLEHIIIELKSDKDRILVASCYRAPNTDQSDFLDSYTRLLENLKKEHCPMIIGIDHNLDLLKSSMHHKTQTFIERNYGFELLPCYNKPTRVTHASATLIDNIFCSSKLQTGSTNYIVMDDISDHLPCVSVFPNAFPALIDETVIIKRKLSEKNITKIKNDLSKINWTGKLSEFINCNDKFNALHDVVTKTLDKHAPLKAYSPKERKLKEPWLTKGLLKCNKKQKELY